MGVASFGTMIGVLPEELIYIHARSLPVYHHRRFVHSRLEVQRGRIATHSLPLLQDPQP